jgi:hypothetical protein
LDECIDVHGEKYDPGRPSCGVNATVERDVLFCSPVEKLYYEPIQ